MFTHAGPAALAEHRCITAVCMLTLWETSTKHKVIKENTSENICGRLPRKQWRNEVNVDDLSTENKKLPWHQLVGIYDLFFADKRNSTTTVARIARAQLRVLPRHNRVLRGQWPV